jgi:anti-sigma B factor antagonist
MTEHDKLMEVKLLGMPLAIQEQSAEQFDALVREFTLIRNSTSKGSIPQRLLDLIDELNARFDAFARAPQGLLAQAKADGLDAVDLTYELPVEAAEAARNFDALLDEADAYCQAGEHLVTLASPPILVAFRRWFLGQFVDQIAGMAPRAWRPPADDNTTEGAGVISSRLEGKHAWVALSGELDLASAPQMRDHLNKLHGQGARVFTIDASAVTFIDSVGLSVLLALYRRCKDEDGTVEVRAPSRAARRTLEVAGLLDVITIVD